MHNMRVAFRSFSHRAELPRNLREFLSLYTYDAGESTVATTGLFIEKEEADCTRRKTIGDVSVGMHSVCDYTLRNATTTRLEAKTRRHSADAY